MSPWFPLTLLIPLSLAAAGHVKDRPAPAGKLVIVKALDVSATEFQWSPAAITAAPGDTIRFEQTTTTPHNVEFKTSPAGVDLGPAKMGPFMVTTGEHYDVVVDGRFKAGAYGFVCTPHEAMGMKGTITVK